MSDKEQISNEEIIRQGGDDVIAKLWENNIGLINLKAWSWIRSGPIATFDNDRKNDMYNDLVQQGYLAVYDTYTHYNPEEGTKFTTLLDFYLKKHFYAVMPLCDTSIYESANCEDEDNKELSIIDTYWDPEDNPYREFDENDQKIFERRILDRVCRSDRDREIIDLRAQGKSAKEIALAQKISEARVNQIIREVSRRARAIKRRK